MIHVQDLTKDFSARRVISDLSFDVKSGEIVGFLGPNGAGKTTTMRILTTYLPPSSGIVEIGGMDILDHSIEVRKLIGYLPETVPLYNEMTIREYLSFMAGLRQVPNLKSRVNQVLEQVHLEDRGNSFIGNLSKGMRQRVGLAQALIHEPGVLILDEPTIGLDPVQIIEVRNLIREIGKEKTVLLSTHILSEAQQVCNRVLIINNGKIVAEDTTEKLQTRILGAQRIFLQIRGDQDLAEELIAATPGVIAVDSRENGKIEFEVAPGQEIRPTVARTLITAGIDLLEIGSSTLSLEEIFLQLTRDEISAEAYDECPDSKNKLGKED